ncbi:hypothetical protein [Halomicronema hongdechloris]|uniref:hypothetical protein n=1 Tax=Halomicronema hongdechloris TaxID=1209493 RepID=UPI001CEC9E8B|nr:hypothetical protein [Halomicronema hongdechloris]
MPPAAAEQIFSGLLIQWFILAHPFEQCQAALQRWPRLQGFKPALPVGEVVEILAL